MKKNILIVDDSALMRKVLSDIISSDRKFTVADLAVNGKEAFHLLVDQGKKYDAVLLDINMPIMNGLELLQALSKHNVKATIIIVSTVAIEGAEETLLALELGAFDFVTKPGSFLDVKSDDFRERLLNCLTLAARTRPLAMPKRSSEHADVSALLKSRVQQRTAEIKKTPLSRNIVDKNMEDIIKRSAKFNKLVALACSTGGPKALQSVIPYLPHNLDAPMLIVQHMPEGFTASLARRLNELSKIIVKEAEDGDILRKGVVYLAMGGRQMRVVKHRDGYFYLTETQENARNGLRPCADIMYESLINSRIDKITCVVLTGMGGDGTSGIGQLKPKNNIHVIAQNEETCIVYGMPKMVVEAGLANEVVPLEKVSDAIAKNVGVQ